MPIRMNQLCLAIIDDQTADATAGNTSDHAHGLGYAPDKDQVIPVPLAADANGTTDNGAVCVCATDDTYVTVKATKNSQPFNLIILLNKDVGNQRDYQA